MPLSYRLESRRLRLEDYHLLLCVDDVNSPVGSRLCVDRDWKEGVALLHEGLISGRYRDLQQVGVPKPSFAVPVAPVFLWYPLGLPSHYQPMVEVCDRECYWLSPGEHFE